MSLKDIKNTNKQKQVQEQKKITLPVLKAAAAFTANIPDPDYVLPAFMRGDVGILSAAGGTGKSFWMLQASFQVAACGYCDYDLSGATVKHKNPKVGSVLYVSLEDNQYQVMRRLKSIRTHWKSDDESNAWLDDLGEDFFHILPLVGTGAVLIDAEHQATAYFNAIIDYAKSMNDCRLIVIDTLRRSHDCDENNNGSMSAVLRQFEAMANKSNSAVLLIHHEGKGSLNDSEAGTAASRGASAITDNARWHMRLQRMTKHDAERRGIQSDDLRRKWIRVSNEKANYGEEMAEAWLLRGEAGVLSSGLPPEPVKNGSKGGRNNG